MPRRGAESLVAGVEAAAYRQVADGEFVQQPVGSRQPVGHAGEGTVRPTEQSDGDDPQSQGQTIAYSNNLPRGRELRVDTCPADDGGQ